MATERSPPGAPSSRPSDAKRQHLSPEFASAAAEIQAQKLLELQNTKQSNSHPRFGGVMIKLGISHEKHMHSSPNKGDSQNGSLLARQPHSAQ